MLCMAQGDLLGVWKICCMQMMEKVDREKKLNNFYNIANWVLTIRFHQNLISSAQSTKKKTQKARPQPGGGGGEKTYLLFVTLESKTKHDILV